MIKEITSKNTLNHIAGGVSISITANSNGERTVTSTGLDNPNARASVDGVAITPEAPRRRAFSSFFSGRRSSVFVRSAGGRTSVTSFTSSNGSVSGTVTSNGVTTTIG